MKRPTRKTSETPVAEENNKASGSAPPNAGPPSQTAVNNERMEHHEFSSDEIAYACEVMTKKYKVDPRLARSFFFYDSAWVRRNGRKNAAKKFRREYIYGSVIDGCSNDQKTCIWPGDTLSWQDESSGTTWVGVHGVDSICVVTRSGDLDVTRLRGSLVQWPVHSVFFDFRKSLNDEIEDLADASSKLRERFHQKIEKPFGIVSVIPDTNKNHKENPHKQAPCTEYGETKAIEFLQEKLNSDTNFTVNETIQTAISAFQHLFQKKFTTDEIKVSVMDPKYSVGTNKFKDPTVEELNISQIKEHFDVINKRGLPCHEKKIEPRPEDSSSGSRRLQEYKLHAYNLRSCSGGGPETRGSTITSEATTE